MSFDRLPKEITNKIFVEHLEPRDWAVVAQVCKGWKGLIEPKSSPEERQRLLALLINSTLWKDLDILQRRGNLSHYFSRLTQDKVRVRWLEEFIAYFWKHVHPDFSIASFSCAIPQTEQPLVECAYRILNNIAIYNPQPDSLQKFFSFHTDYRIQQKETWRDYRKLENTLFAMSMLLQLTHERNRPLPNRSVLLKIICDATLHQWLHGKDIVELNKNFPWLIDDMLKESIKNITTPSTLTPDEKACIPAINDLLGRLTADDWLVYLLFRKYNDLLHHRKRVLLLLEAILHDHPIVKNISLPILIEMNLSNHYINYDGNRYSAADLVLQSENMLLYLKDADDFFYELVSKITLDSFIQATEKNKYFIPRFDFELAKNLLQQNNIPRAKFFLTNAEFLRKLTNKEEQILKIAEHLLLDDLKDVLESIAFLDLLKDMAPPNDKAAWEKRSEFLLEFAKAQENAIPIAIVKNDTVRGMLTPKNVFDISQLNAVAREILIKMGYFPFLKYNPHRIEISLPAPKLEPVTFDNNGIQHPDMPTFPKVTIEKDKLPRPDSPINWKKGLTIAGFIVLGLISIGLMAVGGVGAIIGIPLVIQLVLIGMGVIGFTGTLFGSLSQSKKVEAILEPSVLCSSAKITDQLSKSHDAVRPANQLSMETKKSMESYFQRKSVMPSVAKDPLNSKEIPHFVRDDKPFFKKPVSSNNLTVSHHAPARFTRSR